MKIDPPWPWSVDFDNHPQTEMLRIEGVPVDCKWEATILPMTAARSIAPRELITGEYDDVLAVENGLRGSNCFI